MTVFISRRRLIETAGALAAASFAAPGNAAGFRDKKPKFLDYPFKLGVASGDPVTNGVVIWTRLAPLPFDPRAVAQRPIAVDWMIAEDEKMTKGVRKGRALARPENAHAVHVELRGLQPGRDYFYQFKAGEELSPVGRTRTAPLPGQMTPEFRFAFASCQQYETGYYAAYRDMAEQAPDLVVHLGDYIYESPWGGGIRRHPWREARDLDAYRAYHAVYKLDADLQAAHRAAPWLMTGDDHEVANDYADEMAEDFADPDEFLKRRAAAYKAYFEHMPLRRIATPQGNRMRLYHQARFGDLISFNVLDTRQYRDDHACETADNGGGRLVPESECPALNDPERTMLGRAQENWLYRNFANTRTRWNVIAQQLLFAPLDQGRGEGTLRYTDGWDGYRAARQRLLDAIRRNQPANPVFIGGDIHSYWVNDIADEQGGTIASEFTGTSVSSPGPGYDQFASILPQNPHVQYFESRYRGYCLCTVTPETWRTDLRAVADARDPESAVKTLKSFVVENGRPGAREV